MPLVYAHSMIENNVSVLETASPLERNLTFLHSPSTKSSSELASSRSSTEIPVNSAEASICASTSNKLPPIDNGWRPWLQVFGGWLLMLNSWGMLHSFGAFQNYYTNGGGITNERSPTKIAWIGSVQAFVFLAGGGLVGRAVDYGYARLMITCGTLIVTMSLAGASFLHQYLHIMVAQGLCVGLGMSLFLVPSIAIPRQWFDKRRGLALGIVTTGSSAAGLVYPIILYQLIPRVGFPWALRAVAATSFTTLSIANMILRPRVDIQPQKGTKVFDMSALRNPAFTLYIGGMFATFLGYFVFFNFIVSWAVSGRILSSSLAFYLLPMVNAGSIFGRISTNFLADKIGPLNLQAPVIAMASLMVFAWIGVEKLAPLVVVSILYGFFSGALVSLPNTAVASMTEDLTVYGARLGILFLAMGTASLIGAPSTASILQDRHGGYDKARIWVGGVMLAGSGLTLLSRMFAAKWRIRARV